MSYQDDERRWKRMQDLLAAEASGKTPRPAVSQRTLFGIPSTVEQVIQRVVAEDEEERRMKRQAERVEAPASGRRRVESAEEAASATHVEHPLEPIFDERSRVLVLGTMPSPKSREVGFYYGHPQNRFWRVLAALFDEPIADTNERRRDQLLRHHIALWDVLASCDIQGASDASISGVVPNDLGRILGSAPIGAVFCTGAKAAELYARYCEEVCGMSAVKLPSTSPANAAVSLDELVEAYRVILPHLHESKPSLLDVAEVVKLEQAIAAAGTPLSELMDRAGCAIAHRVHARWPDARVAVLCGNGNNGGDGWVAARDLVRRGHEVVLACAREPEELKAQPARDAALSAAPGLCERASVLVRPGADELTGALRAADVVIDAILGTGFSGVEVKAPFNVWIAAANSCRARGARIVAADVPSGLDAQLGSASEPCIEADETITMIALKPGLANPAAAPYCGNVRVAPLAYLEGIAGAVSKNELI